MTRPDTGRVRTVGVDLASQPAKTAVCAIIWREDGTACVEPPTLPADDEAVISACRSGAVEVGIDCPLGWPEQFISAITAHRDHGPWPGGKPQEMVYRATDRYVHEQVGRWPLTVASDKIGWVAMRCAALLHTLRTDGQSLDRAGGDVVCEVYPAAALRCWGIAPAGAEKRPEVLGGLVDAVREAMPALAFADRAEDACRSSDHAFDALVCALVARAAMIDATKLPETDEQRDLARTEGWIMLPTTPLAGLLHLAPMNERWLPDAAFGPAEVPS